jgi:hypothetical protein
MLVHARRGLVVAALATGLAAVPGAPAGAVDQVKPSAGCAGLSVTDARDDQINDLIGLGLGSKGSPSMDVTEAFFRYDGTTLTANIRIADLDPMAAGPSTSINGQASGLTGVTYYMFFGVNGATRFVSASFDGSAFTYGWGTFDQSSGVFTPGGTTAGKIFEGQDGIVQIDVPAATGATAGTVLAAPHAESDSRLVLLVTPADVAPDSGRGESYTVGQCVDGVGTTKPPTTKPQASGARLPFRAPLDLGSAARANKRKALVFKVRGTSTITNLRVALRRSDGHGKAYAAGGLKRLRGTATLRLAIRRPLKRGIYSLQAIGTVGGKRKTVAQQVRLRK